MYSTLFTITLFFALALRVRADFTVSTPVLTQCQPATLNWDPTTGPYDVIIVAASDPCGDPAVDFGYINTNSYQWPAVTLPAGSQVVISVLDANDQEGWSGTVTVQPGSDDSCLTPQNNSPTQNSPAPSSPTPSTPAQNSPNDSSPTPHTPTTPSSTSSTSPAATVVGAANNGLIGGGVAAIHFNGVAVVVTVLGALAALL